MQGLGLDHRPLRRIHVLRWLAGSGLALIGAAGVAWGCADVSCQPGWRLAAPGYGCDGRAAIGPGNDTRINLLLLMRSLSHTSEKAAPGRQTEGDERQFGQTFMTWQGLRDAFWPKPAAPADVAGTGSPACTPSADFGVALATERGLPATDRAALTGLRARVGCGAVAWDASVTSATGREYLAYLKAADAFYAGNWAVARTGFAGLAGARSRWVAETSTYNSMSHQPPASVAMRNPLGWWWHTPHDTLDKVDAANLVRDTRIFVRAIDRLLSETVLPLDFVAHADALTTELRAIAQTLGERLTLAPLLEAAAELKQAVGRAASDAALMAVARALVPLDYTRGDRFAHDPALPLPAWPVLDPIRALAAAPEGDAMLFARVGAMRARNRMHHALLEATRASRSG